jgi:rSAM/selenodomain-associated transferase 1
MKRALVVIAKHPAPGHSKTRLSPPLSEIRASELYGCFLKDALDTARKVEGVARLIAYAPTAQRGYFHELAPDFRLIPQEGGDLGVRLDNALACCLRFGFDLVIIVGSDCPTLPPAHIARAFTMLEKADVVLGPCDDGGYYLIGLKRRHPRILRGVRMSTPEVLRHTVTRAEAEGLQVALAPGWYDVDTIDDLRRLQAELPLVATSAGSHTLRFLRIHATTTAALD